MVAPVNEPLVSILIPAYNAEKTLAETLESALAQTWRRKEVIVVDDGSADGTAQVAGGFQRQGIQLFTQTNAGQSAALNAALRASAGEYVQYLDADDLLAPDKIERQLAALRPSDGPRLLLSSPWAPFFHRAHRAEFIPNALWEDLSPAEWLYRKLAYNLHMGNATWLVSRELCEAAGPWGESLRYDQDGEYFLRVLLASSGTRFVPGTGLYYRATGGPRNSRVGTSAAKRESLLRSMRLHISSLLSLENSRRARRACLVYLQNWSEYFYDGPAEIEQGARALAAELGGRLEPPALRWKYAWLRPILGRRNALALQRAIPAQKAAILRACDWAASRLEPAQPISGTKGK
jgi:glycosyltransferase involved in cell wall biosynthesis